MFTVEKIYSWETSEHEFKYFGTEELRCDRYMVYKIQDRTLKDMTTNWFNENTNKYWRRKVQMLDPFLINNSFNNVHISPKLHWMFFPARVLWLPAYHTCPVVASPPHASSGCQPTARVQWLPAHRTRPVIASPPHASSGGQPTGNAIIVWVYPRTQTFFHLVAWYLTDIILHENKKVVINSAESCLSVMFSCRNLHVRMYTYKNIIQINNFLCATAFCYIHILY